MTVGTAEEALSLLSDDQKHYDVVVLDVMLPGMDGFALASNLRAQGQFVPILMLTARGQAKTCCAGSKRVLMIIFRSRLIFRFCWRASMRCCDVASGFIKTAPKFLKVVGEDF
jgi:CheY-like chemotaxis protein